MWIDISKCRGAACRACFGFLCRRLIRAMCSAPVSANVWDVSAGDNLQWMLMNVKGSMIFVFDVLGTVL
jgi:hypothetical protein